MIQITTKYIYNNKNVNVSFRLMLKIIWFYENSNGIKGPGFYCSNFVIIYPVRVFLLMIYNMVKRPILMQLILVCIKAL